MKKYLLILAVTGLLASCSSSSEEAKQTEETVEEETMTKEEIVEVETITEEVSEGATEMVEEVEKLGDDVDSLLNEI